MILETALGDIPFQLLVSIPAALAVIYVVRMFLASQKEWKEDLKTVVGVSNEVIERNTRALIEIKGVLEHCKDRVT